MNNPHFGHSVQFSLRTLYEKSSEDIENMNNLLYMLMFPTEKMPVILMTSQLKSHALSALFEF